MQVWGYSDERWDQRVDELEKELESTPDLQENQSRSDELYFLISGLLGKNNLNLLREYTDRIIARYNADVAYYYQKGREDALIEPAETTH